MTFAAGGHLAADEAIRVGTDIQRRLGLKTSRQEPLARFTTMRVGGPADLFAEVHNLFELRGVVRYARQRGIPLTLVGRGSDVVISDLGVAGLVVLDRAQGHRFEGRRLVAEAGLPMARAATLARTASLSGLEFGLAIPGTVGGAVWANAGAHERDVRAVLVEATVVGPDGREAAASPDELGLAYRTSRLKAAPPGDPEVVTAATFELEPDDPARIDARLDEIRRWRQTHQPLGLPSAGSFFRNPPSGPSAAELVEARGLKGHRLGGATVSVKHANFIVNDRRGTAADIRALGELVRAAVLAATGTALEPEVVFVGDWAAP